MFNLIISIIAIALVVVLAGASLYYGGDAFNSGSADAKAATFINQAQQIQASATLYKANEGGTPQNIASLTLNGKYLSASPKLPVSSASAWELTTVGGGKFDIVYTTATIGATSDTDITEEICDTINEDGAGVVFCEVVALADVSGRLPTNTYTDGAEVQVYMAL